MSLMSRYRLQEGPESLRSCRRGMHGLRLGSLLGQCVCGRLILEYLFFFRRGKQRDAQAPPFR